MNAKNNMNAKSVNVAFSNLILSMGTIFIDSENGTNIYHLIREMYGDDLADEFRNSFLKFDADKYEDLLEADKKAADRYFVERYDLLTPEDDGCKLREVAEKIANM